MAIADGLIYLWTGTHAGIPAGFVRETTLDARYTRGADSGIDPAGTGGAATHSHSETGTHTPLQNAHTHTVSGAATSDTPSSTEIGTTLSHETHSHANSTSASTTATNNSGTATWATAVNDPAFYKPIFIRSLGGLATGIPDQAVAYTDQTSNPTGFTTFATLANRFALGASTAADAGGTGGNLAAHTHAAAASHTHTQNSHTHAATNSSVASATTGAGTSSGAGNEPQKSHRHSVSLAATTAVNQSTSPTLQSGNGEPPWVKLLPIQNTSGGALFPDKHIALWLGTLATIPTNFALVASTVGKFVKGAANSGEIGSTGGADTHTHTSDTCQPTQTSHTHTASATNPSYVIIPNAPDIATYSPAGHTHVWSCSTDTATNQAATITVGSNSSKSAYPLYTDVAYIQYTAPITSNYFRKFDPLPRRVSRIR